MSVYQGNPSPKNGDGIYWLIALGLIFTGIAAPVGVLMIVMKLLGEGAESPARAATHTTRSSMARTG